MSATLRCDACGETIDGRDRQTPRLLEYGDLKPTPPSSSVALGIGGHQPGDPVKSDETRLREQRKGLPGYAIKRRLSAAGTRGLVALWVTWRDGEDYCKQCVRDAICAEADRLRAQP